jgi:predicted glycosyltransferase
MSGSPYPGDGPRIAVFTHDTFGLGHVRRCLRIIRRLAEDAPDAAILFITGSPAVQPLRDLPPTADLVKIPTLVRTGAKGSRPPHLPLPMDDVSRLRRSLVRKAVLGFRPHVFLVDNFPLGSREELRPTLEELPDKGGQAVLGLRDILDAPEVVRESWKRQGIYQVLATLYERVLVYGFPAILDVASAYGLSPNVAEKVRYCGYVTEAHRRTSPEAAFRSLGIEPPFLLVTGGGGGDAFPLLSAALDALPRIPDLPAVLVAGPLMGLADREVLRARAAEGNATLLDEVADLPALMAAAEVVVAMGGYNVAAEIAAVRPRAILVPRTWRFGEHQVGEAAGVEWEQILRARAFERLGLVHVIPPAELSPERLAEAVATLRSRPRPAPSTEFVLGGIERAAAEILSLVPLPREAPHVVS